MLWRVPWDGGTTNRPGARHGPREIRNSSSLIRLYPPKSLKSPYNKFNVADIGDCPVNPADLQDSLKKIENFYNLSDTIGHGIFFKSYQIIFLIFKKQLFFFNNNLGFFSEIKIASMKTTDKIVAIKIVNDKENLL